MNWFKKKKIEKQHAEKCASNIHKYYGDSRNLPWGNEMLDCDCDGYHTFTELYDHRMTLYISLCWVLKNDAGHTGIWRSKRHSDGQLCFGTGTMFALGIGKENDMQISYHIPIERWDEANFAETLEIAPKWDGHTSDDVIERLKKIKNNHPAGSTQPISEEEWQKKQEEIDAFLIEENKRVSHQ